MTFISRSDLRGGAAIVTYRLVEALRKEGVDARMLVCEKMSDSDFVDLCATKLQIQAAFLKERLEVYMHNGRNRKTLFQIDPAFDGLPVWQHSWVKEADAIVLGWVNQGMLSIKGVRKLSALGKPLIWIMHDMWNMTGVCHHAGACTGFLHECGDCPLLGPKANMDDISHRTWENKKRLYDYTDIKFVAVSTWLAERARQSTLMRDLDVEVIPNPFTLEAEPDPQPDDEVEEIWEEIGSESEEEKKANEEQRKKEEEKRKKEEARTRVSGIAFGAARLDDPIKGLPVLKKALKIVRENHPDIASRLRLVTFGKVKDPASLEGLAIKHRHLGTIQGQKAIRDAYRECDIVVSTSEFETLPGTLIEGQAYGCIPVALDHGGQKDIIQHRVTGWLATWNDSEPLRAERIAEGIVWAFGHRNDTKMKEAMRASVANKFGAQEVARRILNHLGLPTATDNAIPTDPQNNIQTTTQTQQPSETQDTQPPQPSSDTDTQEQ